MVRRPILLKFVTFCHRWSSRRRHFNFAQHFCVHFTPIDLNRLNPHWCEICFAMPLAWLKLKFMKNKNNWRYHYINITSLIFCHSLLRARSLIFFLFLSPHPLLSRFLLAFLQPYNQPSIIHEINTRKKEH